MPFADYIDIVEWIISLIYKQYSPVQILNCRITFNLLIKLLGYFIWFFCATQYRYNSTEYAFSLVFWLIFDIQILLELEYIQSNQALVFIKRHLLYKTIDTLQTLVALIFTIFLLENEEMFYIKVALFSLFSFDILMNVYQIILTVIKFQRVQFTHSYADSNQSGGVKLFCFGIILGSVYAFYFFISNLLYFYEIQEKASNNNEYAEDFANIPDHFRDLRLIFAIVLQLLIDLTNIALIYYFLDDNFFSKDRCRNSTFFFYGLVFGMLNCYLLAKIGAYIIITSVGYILFYGLVVFCNCCYRCFCPKYARVHQQQQEQEQEQQQQVQQQVQQNQQQPN